jgi:hypothetical protein
VAGLFQCPSLNLTLLNNTDLIGVAWHRAAQRFEQLNK